MIKKVKIIRIIARFSVRPIKKLSELKANWRPVLGKILKFFIFLLIFIALVQFVFLVLIYGFRLDNKAIQTAEKVVPYPIAIVNQNVISFREYNQEKSYIYHFYESTKQEDIDFEIVDNQILDQLIENKVIASEAWRNGIKITGEDVDSTLETVYEQNGGKEKVEKVLNDLYDLNSRSFRRLIKNQLLRDKVNEELIMRVTASHILIRVDRDAPADKVAEAKTKIDGYLNEAKGGADFAELAKQYSEDTGSNEQGGKLEPFAQGEMVEEFSQIAFSTPVGQISDPVLTDFGWHIIKVESKTGKIEKKFSEWLSEQRDKNLIWKFI